MKIDLPERITRSYTFTFGLYKGQSFEALLQTHPDYLEYCLNHIFGFANALAVDLEEEIERTSQHYRRFHSEPSWGTVKP